MFVIPRLNALLRLVSGSCLAALLFCCGMGRVQAQNFLPEVVKQGDEQKPGVVTQVQDMPELPGGIANPDAGQSREESATAGKAATAAEIRLRDDVTFLADDRRGGRAPGDEGIEAAAGYIADLYKQLGLKPAPGADGYFQTFSLGGRAKIGEPVECVVTGADGKTFQAEFTKDFTPLAIGSSGEVDQLPLVFAGYGITAKDAAKHLDYDDYAGLDATGKAVLVIRREPQQNLETSPFDGKRTSDYATFEYKASNAFQHGAKLLLIVNDLASLNGEADALIPFARAGTDSVSKLPIVFLTRSYADQLLAAAGEPSLTDLEKAIDDDLKPRSRELKGLKLTAKLPVVRTAIETKNVIGVLEGSGPHADETIVVGGHYDHLGRGGLRSGSLAPLSSDIHNGADDNASGTAMVLEMARRMASRRDVLPRRIVFIAFSGEERGLIGSKYYVDHPLYPLSSTVMMVNFDMVGRLNAKNELTMIGSGSSPGMTSLVEALGPSSGLTIKKVTGLTDGFGGSDHQSFYGKDIPVIFAFTGVHADYHRPSDDSDRINYEGMARIADYMELILLDLARRPDRPAFTRLAPPSQQAQSASVSMTVTLGVMPDYSDDSKEGMKLDDVRAGGAADKAGIKKGDSIIKIGEKPVATIHDYMAALKGFKPGDKVDVIVRRDGKEVTIPVLLSGASGTPHE